MQFLVQVPKQEKCLQKTDPIDKAWKMEFLIEIWLYFNILAKGLVRILMDYGKSLWWH